MARYDNCHTLSFVRIANYFLSSHDLFVHPRHRILIWTVNGYRKREFSGMHNQTTPLQITINKSHCLKIDRHPPHLRFYSSSATVFNLVYASRGLRFKWKRIILFHWQPGITTDEIDKAVHQMIIDNGAYPSPLGYCGYPKSVCTSVNECICHGIPDSRPLEVSQPKSSSNNFWHMENSYNSSSLWQDGDIINIDVTVYLNVSQSKLICTSWNEERNHCDYLSFINALHLFSG